jgi:hypothetical protein
MSPLALLLLRRVTLYAVVLAVLLATVPRLLTAFGVLGPSLEEEIGSAENSLGAARSYGAKADEPAYKRAAEAIAKAREHAARSERWPAKRALGEAREAALEAQRVALATREESRRGAQKTVNEIDRQLNELEDLYGDVVKQLEKPEAERLLAMMKSTRQKSATLILLFDEQGYEKVLAGAADVRSILAATRAELLAARAARRKSS